MTDTNSDDKQTAKAAEANATPAKKATRKAAPKPAKSVPDAPISGQPDSEKIDLTPDNEHNNVSQPGPTTFVRNPDRRPVPDSQDAEGENTPQEDAGPLPKNLSAERIVQVWDGGERIIAGQMAKEATKANRDKATAARPEMLRYVAGDPG